ncbi:hypothetical protein H8E77_06755 [bacterium]|nr:hypothetical protein [bacterium]
MNIHEPTIRQYIYFVRSIDTLEGTKERDSQIEGQIESLRERMEELSRKTIEEKIILPPLDRNKSRPIFDSGWLGEDEAGRDYFFAVSARSDTVIVQSAYYRSSEGEQNFQQIRDELWDGSEVKKFRDAKSYFIGETIVLCALTEQIEKETAQAILSVWVDADESHSVSDGFDIGIGTFYYDTSEPAICILLYPDEQAEDAAGDFLNLQFPIIELHRHKCEAQVSLYEQSQRSDIEQSEKDLRDELDATEEPTMSFRELQRRTIALSELQQQYAEKLGELEKIQNTVEINIRNLQDKIEEAFKPDACPHLYKELLEKYQRSSEQMGYDKCYFEVADQRATIARETLQTLVEVERGKTERFITYLLFALGTVLAAGQVIDSNPKTTLLRGIIVGGGIVLVGVGMFIYRKFQGKD